MRSLNNLERLVVKQFGARNTLWKAQDCWSLGGPLCRVLLEQLNGLGTHRGLFGLEVGEDIQRVFGKSTRVVSGDCKFIDSVSKQTAVLFDRRILDMPHPGKIR